jgi:hypothetical protein
MEYTFKQAKLSEVEKLWLNEILKLNFLKVDLKSLKVKLWNNITKDFEPAKIDNRLVRDNRLTLIGLWYVDPNNALFNHVSKTIEIIKDLIIKNPGINRIKATETASLAGITLTDAEIVLMLIYDLGGFFGSVSSSNTNSRYGHIEAGFQQNDSAYDAFLKFESLEQSMEQFFVRQAPLSNANKKQPRQIKSPLTRQSLEMQKQFSETWDDIRNDFDMSKRTFGKKIHFVTDEYKRRVIFRDVEQAYWLAKNGFCKPAVVLAGSIIEELLRLYLENKNVKPSKNTFDEYVKACENSRLLKSAISRLSDSVRHFRNLVHLENEKSQKYAISKSTAHGAVSSIFTIANDFET